MKPLKSKKDSGEPKATVFGFGFYRREQWPLLLETAEDRAELEDTYEEWLQNLKKSLKNMCSLGVEPLRVDIDMNEFLAWCEAKSRKRNGESRAEFITELLRQGRGRLFDVS